MTKAEKYATVNGKYLKEADVLMEKGDYVRASEKFWGAAAVAVKSAAAQRRVNIRSHEGLNRFIAKLEDEVDDPELPRYLAIAAYLHQNFYENWLPLKTVMNYGEAVKQLVEKLEALMEQPVSVAVGVHVPRGGDLHRETYCSRSNAPALERKPDALCVPVMNTGAFPMGFLYRAWEREES